MTAPALPPYADVLGARVERDDAGVPRLVMPFAETVLGRPGFLHGGAITGLLELAAIVALSDALDGGGRIKPINVTVDFTRGGRERILSRKVSSRGSARGSRMSNRLRGRTTVPNR